MMPGNFYHKKRQHQNHTAWLHGNLDFMKKHRKRTQWLSSQAGYYYVLSAGDNRWILQRNASQLVMALGKKYIKIAKYYQSKTMYSHGLEIESITRTKIQTSGARI